MPSQYIIGSSTLTDIADAIRLKGGTSSPMAPTEMPNLIDAIPSGGSDIPPHAYQSSTISSFSSDATYILDWAFHSCKNLISVDFPQASYIGYSAFAYCDNLTTASFPQASYIGSSAFYFCYNLTTLSFPQASYIGEYAFRKCSNLTSLYLLGSSIPSLSNSGAFLSTPIGGWSTSTGQYGSIFVPASLFKSYKTAANWRYFSSRFVSI